MKLAGLSPVEFAELLGRWLSSFTAIVREGEC